LHRYFLDTLRALPEVRVVDESCFPDLRYDAEVAVEIAGKPVSVHLEIKKTAYPRDVRQWLWQLGEYSAALGEKTHYLLLAESLSPGAKELLRAESVGYFDAGGSLFIPIPGAYVYVDKPPVGKQKKVLVSLFSGRRARVSHALLLNPADWFSVAKIAELSQVAPSTASVVLTELERFEWVDSQGKGPQKLRHLSQPGSLLDAWASWVGQLPGVKAPASRRYYVPGLKGDAKSLQLLGSAFDAHGVTYAVSHEAAAQVYSPFLSSVSQIHAQLVQGVDADKALASLGARVVTQGANLIVTEAGSEDDLLFCEQIDGVWLASPVQVYLDLVQAEGRSREMADHLRQEMIGF
jgi:hypothetical protein